MVEGVTKNGEAASLDNISFSVAKGDKIAFVGEDERSRSLLFDILAGEVEPDAGSCKWGVTITNAYFPKDNNAYFDGVDLDKDNEALFTAVTPAEVLRLAREILAQGNRYTAVFTQE